MQRAVALLKLLPTGMFGVLFARVDGAVTTASATTYSFGCMCFIQIGAILDDGH